MREPKEPAERIWRKVEIMAASQGAELNDSPEWGSLLIAHLRDQLSPPNTDKIIAAAEIDAFLEGVNRGLAAATQITGHEPINPKSVERFLANLDRYDDPISKTTYCMLIGSNFLSDNFAPIYADNDSPNPYVWGIGFGMRFGALSGYIPGNLN